MSDQKNTVQQPTGREAEASKENKMGSMPVNRLLLSMSVPMMISMLVQALYNIVDSIFVSRISEDALTAVSLIFPIQTLMIAFASGLGVGFSSLLSRSLGEKDLRKVSKSAANGIILEALSAVLFFFVGIFLSRLFLESQTDNADIVTYGTQYMTVICVFSFCVFTQITFERMLQATGKTIYSMITQSVGAIFNICMDPVLIFGLFGMPKMGVTGAAAATVMGQFLAGILGIILNLRYNHEVKIQKKDFRPDRAIMGEICFVGIPSMVMQAIGSVMTYGMNHILIAFSTTAAAVFGVYFKINSFVFMPVFGLNNGLVPIIAFNYGAAKRSRMEKAFHLGIFYAVLILVFGLALFQMIPGFFLGLFNASENMMSIGIPALRIISLSFPLAAFCIACGSLFQALGNGIYSMVVSIMRQLVVLLPAAYFLSLSGILDRVWWSYVIAEVASVIVTLLFLRRIYRTTISRMPAEDEL